jgi:hypothetical protein
MLLIGLAASMASFLLCAGSRGRRFALPHSRIMIHQPMGGAQGIFLFFYFFIFLSVDCFGYLLLGYSVISVSFIICMLTLLLMPYGYRIMISILCIACQACLV